MKRVQIFLVICLFSFLSYGISVKNLYNQDDYLVVKDNIQILKGVSGIPEILTSNYIKVGGKPYLYRPFTKITYAIENQFIQQNPHFSHFISVGLYALLGYLIFMFLSFMMPNIHWQINLIVTLLFIVHPIHSEVVASLKNREELFVLMFGVLASFSYLKFARTKMWLFFFGGILAYTFGLLTKISIMSFLPVFLLVLFFFSSSKLKDYFLVGGSVICLNVLYFLFTYLFLPGFGRTPTIKEGTIKLQEDEVWLFIETPLVYLESISERLGSAFVGLGYYIKLLIFPHPMSMYYGYESIPLVGMVSWQALFSLAIYLGLIYLGFKLYKSHKQISFAIGFYLSTIFIFSNTVVLAPGTIADRFLFTPSFGFCLGIVFLLLYLFKIDKNTFEGLSQNSKQFFLILIALILFGGIVKSNIRTMDWYDNKTLIERDLTYFPNNGVMHVLLTTWYHRKYSGEKDGDLVKEFEKKYLYHFAEVQRIDPPSAEKLGFTEPKELVNKKVVEMARGLISKGEVEEGLNLLYSISKGKHATFSSVQLALSTALKHGKSKLAEDFANLNFSSARNYKEFVSSALFFKQLGNKERAIDAYKAAISSKNTFKSPHENLINLYKEIGDFDNAQKHKSILDSLNQIKK